MLSFGYPSRNWPLASANRWRARTCVYRTFGTLPFGVATVLRAIIAATLFRIEPSRRRCEPSFTITDENNSRSRSLPRNDLSPAQRYRRHIADVFHRFRMLLAFFHYDDHWPRTPKGRGLADVFAWIKINRPYKRVRRLLLDRSQFRSRMNRRRYGCTRLDIRLRMKSESPPSRAHTLSNFEWVSSSGRQDFCFIPRRSLGGSLIGLRRIFGCSNILVPVEFEFEIRIIGMIRSIKILFE